MQEEQKKQQTAIATINKYSYVIAGFMAGIISMLVITSYLDQRALEKEIIGAVSAGFAKVPLCDDAAGVKNRVFEARLHEAFNKGKNIGFDTGENSARKQIASLMQERKFEQRSIDLALDGIVAHVIDSETQGQKQY
jgi:hypothetical protein